MALAATDPSNSGVEKPSGTGSVECRDSGIEAFDEETGGFPAGKLTLVAGGANMGKTILGRQFLCQGLDNGERVFLVTSDKPELWLDAAEEFKWSMRDAVEYGSLNILYQKSQVPHIITSEEELNGMLSMLESEVLPWEPTRLVIDSGVPFIELMHPDFRRVGVRELVRRLAGMNLTTLLTMRMPASTEAMALRKQIEELAGCSIHLDEQRTTEEESRRRLVCRKHIALDPPYPVYDFTIEAGHGLLTEGSTSLPLQAPAEEVKLPQAPKASGGGLFASAMSMARDAQAPEEPEPANEVPEKAKRPPVRFSFRNSPPS